MNALKSGPGLASQISTTTYSKDYVEKLVKENLGMMKVIEDQNKLIEFSRAEMQKMRTHLQNFKLQNWSLAQSNSQMQAEVNIARDRLKVVQHELACKEALSKIKKAPEDTRDADKSNVQPEVEYEATNLEAPQVTIEEEPSHHNRKCSVRIRSRSLSSTTSIKPEQEAAETKRPCLRRQSARFKSEQPENMLGTEDINSSVNQSNSEIAPRRSSTGGGRPSRKAAEKVQSYRERPLNIKLRREV